MSRVTSVIAVALCASAAALGAASTASGAVSSPGPTAVTATPGSDSATVRWSAPATVDGAATTSFTVTASSGQTMTAQVPNDWAIVPGLTDGRAVTFTVTATSAAGTTSASSPSAPVTPQAIPAPRHVLLGAPRSVSYDHYSVIIGGRRVLLWAGEFDAYRLPSPSLWIDRLQEMKAAGYNAVTIYFNWDETSPAPGVYDFGGVRDVNLLLNDAQRVGLYVIARPGPYINAESNAGGLAGWLASEPAGSRTDDPEYLAAADQWLSEIDPVIAAHQITRGGDVILYQIENEYGYTDPAGEAYFGNIETQAHEDGIDVPTITNDVGGYPTGWDPGTPDAPDLVGTDQYPEAFNCADTSKFTAPPVLTQYHTATQPLAVPEYQGGAFDSWGGVGYADCAALTGPSFEDTFYRWYLAQGATLQSIYMAVGGTDWGFIPAPFMYTSYDYGAAITEPGTLSDKYDQLKLAGELSQALPDLAMTDQQTAPTIAGLTTFVARNPVTGATFTYLGNLGTAAVTTALPADSALSVTIPAHEAKLLVSEARLPGGARIAATTSELITQIHSGDRETALLDGDPGATGATVLTLSRRPTVTSSGGAGPLTSAWNPSTHELTLRYTTTGLRTVTIATGARRLTLLIADDVTAGQFWVQHTAGGPLLERGAELVRSARVSGRRAVLNGDTANAGPLTVWGGVHAVSWDGRALATTSAPGGAVTVSLPGPPHALALPTLTRWRFAEGSPERLPGFDDAGWTAADHTVTDNPIQPAAGQPVLYAQDYGYDNGFVWYRGHFTATGDETSVSITADTGPFGSFAVWLNGRYLGTAQTPTAVESMSDTPLTQSFTIPAGALAAGHAAEISVLAEDQGQDESFENALGLDSDKTPRGLESVSLAESSGSAPAIAWKIDGACETCDPVRGVLNNAGLYGSAHGWALPGIPDRSWTPVSLPDTWSSRGVGPGVGWYRTTFALHVPRDVWAPIGLTLTPPGADGPRAGAPDFQALIYLNGWLIGRYINDLGPQSTFYLPQGLLRTDGHNTLAIAEWSLAPGAGGLGRVTLSPYEILRGGIRVRDVASPGYRATVVPAAAAASRAAARKAGRPGAA